MVNINRVEVLIREHGWSNSYFCGLFGKNKGWIRDWKRGHGLPDENTLQQIADRLETSIDYLTDKTDIKNKPSAEAKGYSKEDLEFLNRIKKLFPENRKHVENEIEFLLAGQHPKE